jgi:hypothetical protein
MTHNCVLHEMLSVLDPAQEPPPLAGIGLLQSLVRGWVPPPHVTLQVPEAVHSLQLPSEIKRLQIIHLAQSIHPYSYSTVILIYQMICQSSRSTYAFRLFTKNNQFRNIALITEMKRTLYCRFIKFMQCKILRILFLLMTHNCALHEMLSVPDPEQIAPPLDGGGLLQSLVLGCISPPQVTLQVPEVAQFPQLPSEKKYRHV